MNLRNAVVGGRFHEAGGVMDGVNARAAPASGHWRLGRWADEKTRDQEDTNVSELLFSVQYSDNVPT